MKWQRRSKPLNDAISWECGHYPDMWRLSKTNGITEGFFQRKMKLLQRRAYGYRIFKNYRLRVLIECGHVVV